jgi:poly(3-hydroxybutyrate) depolymerase
MAMYRVDPDRVYVAGMSAGGAMAAIMGATYPMYTPLLGFTPGSPAEQPAICLLRLSRCGCGGRDSAAGEDPGAQAGVPLIVFHGDRDTTVHPRNSLRVLARAARLSSAASDRELVIEGQVPGGHSYTRTLYQDAQAQIVAEHWLVHGAAHAWSAEARPGSFTDPHGLDATAEILRFFRERPKPRVAV